mmetsp:Transcript_21113/g.66180  ORF Transcript_21113/g.66180 Transcript_21113/m.66180 type:complete len:237 (-) Transcript_21113:72-782(-)
MLHELVHAAGVLPQGEGAEEAVEQVLQPQWVLGCGEAVRIQASQEAEGLHILRQGCHDGLERQEEGALVHGWQVTLPEGLGRLPATPLWHQRGVGRGLPVERAVRLGAQALRRVLLVEGRGVGPQQPVHAESLVRVLAASRAALLQALLLVGDGRNRLLRLGVIREKALDLSVHHAQLPKVLVLVPSNGRALRRLLDLLEPVVPGQAQLLHRAAHMPLVQEADGAREAPGRCSGAP